MMSRFMLPFKVLKNGFPFLMGLLAILVIFGLLNSQIILAKIAYAQHGPVKAVVSPISETVTPPEEVTIPDNSLEIPKIGAQLPVIFDMKSTNETDVQVALRSGVLHYGQTAMPGEKGNLVIVGHSSGPVWSPGDYKFAFTLLDKLTNGDVIIIRHGSVKYTYEVTNSYTVVPSEISVLSQGVTPELTLITCTPIGSSKNRLIIKAKQVLPNPEYAKPLVAGGVSEEITKLPN